MAVVETDKRNIPCDTPNDAHALVQDYTACKQQGTMLRVEYEGVAEWLNPDHIIGITDGTVDGGAAPDPAA
jgi:hypothetical protein